MDQSYGSRYEGFEQYVWCIGGERDRNKAIIVTRRIDTPTQLATI